MDVHQTEFLHAVVLAGAVALGMTAWDTLQERAQVAGTPAMKAEPRNVASAAQASKDPIVR